MLQAPETPFPADPAGAPAPTAFPWELQLYSNWCWAACARTVLAALNRPSPRQCEIVERSGPNGCCSAADADTSNDEFAVGNDAPGCNDGFPPSGIPGFYQVNFNVAASTITPSEQAIVGGLASGKPVQIRYQWGDGPFGHYALLFGFVETPNGRFYRVSDPEFGRLMATYAHISSAYEKGQLAQAWTF